MLCEEAITCRGAGGGWLCLSQRYACDGVLQCMDGEDEEAAPTFEEEEVPCECPDGEVRSYQRE